MVFIEVYKNDDGDVYVSFKDAVTTQTLVNDVVVKAVTVPSECATVVLKLTTKDNILTLFTFDAWSTQGRPPLASLAEREALYERVLVAARRSALTFCGHPLTSLLELYEMTPLYFYPEPRGLEIVDQPYVHSDHFFECKTF